MINLNFIQPEAKNFLKLPAVFNWILEFLYDLVLYLDLFQTLY